MGKVIIFDWVGTLFERDKDLFGFSEDVVKELSSKYKLALISKYKDVEARQREMEESSIAKYFEVIKSVKEKTKDDFLEVINKLEVSPEEVIVVGDRMSKEIKIGNELGCKTFWIQIGDRSFDSPTGEPNYKVDSVKEMMEILE